MPSMTWSSAAIWKNEMIKIVNIVAVVMMLASLISMCAGCSKSGSQDQGDLTKQSFYGRKPTAAELAATRVGSPPPASAQAEIDAARARADAQRPQPPAGNR
ncbi:MAG: hypothetical protein ABIY70_26710 [Capsulimonas sp.]|uniref:hypothetical protein n=1 Tax=Capsulimonas sp. TaxID=2494211 RepID=UPI003266A2D0